MQKKICKGDKCMIIFIGCVKAKQNKRCKAEELYISPLFKMSLQYAKKLNPDKIYILSAKYGVIELKQEIEPYEETLNTKGKEEQKKWAISCVKQLQDKKTNFNEKAIWLCGKNYNKYLSKVFKNSEFPFGNLKFGERLKFLKRSI